MILKVHSFGERRANGFYRLTDFVVKSIFSSAGTGLLSMMAARAMDSVRDDSKGMVTACESYLPMVKLMRKVLRLNGMERKVKVINKRSDELQFGADITSRADALVSFICIHSNSLQLSFVEPCKLQHIQNQAFVG